MESNTINILIAINKNYIIPAETMLYSLAQNTNSKIRVFLLHTSLKDKEVRKIHKYIRAKCNATMEAIKVEKKIFEKYPLQKNFSIEIYLRLIAQDILPQNLNKIMWLDSDIIVTGDVSEFYNTSFDNKFMLVCEDVGDREESVIRERKSRLELPKLEKYFNSGVLLINLQKMRKEFDLDSMFCYMNNNLDKLYYPDQDVLNKLLFNEVKFMDCEQWNKQIFSYEHYDINELAADANIIHFVGEIKPWNFRYKTDNRLLYMKMLKKISFFKYMEIGIKRRLFLMKCKTKD